MSVLKKDVKIGSFYAIKHTSSNHGRLNVIQITGECRWGGWYALNLKTNRQIRIKSNQKLRYEVKRGIEGGAKWIPADA